MTAPKPLSEELPRIVDALLERTYWTKRGDEWLARLVVELVDAKERVFQLGSLEQNTLRALIIFEIDPAKYAALKRRVEENET